MNSQRKGKVKELEVAHQLTTLTKEKFRRLGGREIDKIYLSGDVCAENPNSFYRQFSLEVKARKSGYWGDWLSKAIDDSHNKTALMFSWDYKNKRWVAVMEADKFIRLTEQLKGYARGE